MLSRRSLIGLVAAAGAIGTRQAMAFTVQEASSDTVAAYLSACGGQDQHDRLLAEIDAVLADASVDEATKATLRDGVNCPICGCRVHL